MADTETVFIRFRSTTGGWLVNPELRPLMLADASVKGTNLNAVIVGILSKRYGVAVEVTGRAAARSDAKADVDSHKARLPLILMQAVGHASQSAYPRRSAQDEIRYALCEHYGLAVPA